MNWVVAVSVLVPVAIVVLVVVFVVRSGAFGGMSKKKQQQMQGLLASGAKARATILRVTPTGMIVNNINLQCVITFRLQPLTGGAAFDGTKKVFVPQTSMPRAGDVWPAWYDVNDHTIFAVGMPDGATPEQIPVYRQFGIPHPLDQSPPPPPPPPTPPSFDPTQASTSSAPAAQDPVTALERLSQLRATGALTEEEFQAAKAKVLGS